MPNVTQLQEATTEFFNRYLAKDLNLSPVWSDPKKMEGTNGLAPNGDKSGCYAFLSGDEVLYIGVARSWNEGKYQKNAIDRRVRERLYVAPDNTYRIRDDCRSEGYESFVTIGLPDDAFFLAASLEEYLLHVLKPVTNVLSKGRRAL